MGTADYNVRVFVATGSCAGSPVIEKNVPTRHVSLAPG